MNSKFFSEMFQENDDYKLIWKLSDKKSHWFKKIDELLSFIELQKENVFFGIGTTSLTIPSYKRAEAKDIKSIRCLHMDIDILFEMVHKKKKLPATAEEAIEIAKSILEPTYIVNSGHGLHGYWFFNEHQTISNADFWTLLGQAWQKAHNDKFPQYNFDATHDLSRILRCPGSINTKDPNNPVECKIIEHNKTAYYELSEIEDAIDFDYKKTIELAPISRTATPKNTDRVITATGPSRPRKFVRRLSIAESRQFLLENNIPFNAELSISSDLQVALQNMEPEFHSELCNQTGRGSASEYQLRIANIAVKNGLPDDAVIALLIQHRRYNKHSLDMDRPDKYVNDLLKAKETYTIKRIDNTPTARVTNTDKEAIRSYLYSQLGVEILHLWRYNRSPNEYFELELTELPGDPVFLGSMAEGIMNQNNFDSKISAKLLRAPKRLSNKNFYDRVVTNLLRIVEDGVSAETATFNGQVRVWVEEFLYDNTILDTIEEYIGEASPGNPFYHNNKIYFLFEKLSSWIKIHRNHVVDEFHFSIAMSRAGFKQKYISCGEGKRVLLWATPQNYLAAINVEPPQKENTSNSPQPK